MRNLLFNDGWEFAKLPLGTELAELKGLKPEWIKVNIPHDWLIYDAKDLYQDAHGWYRKSFSLDKDENKRYLINFDGVYMNSTVYVNGEKAGDWRYGYSAFEFDITELLKNGDNEIMVLVRHQSPNSRWYSGAGIYRNVYFKTVNSTCINTNGVYISTNKTENDLWKVEVDTEICGNAEGASVSHSLELLSCASKTSAEKISCELIDIKYEGNSCSFFVKNPKLWDIEEPNLYALTTKLIINGETVDEVTNRFGFRTIEFTVNEGFFLNGRHLKLNGVCEHHDLGCLGSAFNKEAMRRKFVILRQMGVNSVRTSHNMPSKEFMELADEFGMLIDSEAFDMWRRSKTQYDYGRFFNDNFEKDVESWIKRDRNHPSVIMWSIGNEIYDTHADESAVQLTKDLMDNVRKHDYRGNAPVTIGSNYMPWEGAQKCADVLKLAGYNYAEKYYNEHHEAHPDWMIYGSETSSTVQSRGVYHFPYSVSILADDDEQCSTLGNCTTSWGAESSEFCIKAERDTPFSAGQYLWSGFDYIGEPTPYHNKNSYFGQIDTAGFPKDTFYIYQAEWTDYKKNPMVHLFPYWDFNEGQIIDVRISSNAPAVELFVNGASKGRKEIDHKHGKELTQTWQVPYTKGFIEAVAYDENGNEIARERRDSFTDAVKLCVEEFGAGEKIYRATGRDMMFLTVYAVDKDGNIVENAVNRVDAEVIGEGRLAGLDNGDSTDFEDYKCNSRRMFSGKLLVAVMTTDKAGSVEVKLTSPGLEGCIFKTETVQAAEGEVVVSFVKDTVFEANNSRRMQGVDIPIRKLDIVVDGSRNLNADNRSVKLEAVIYPENATYDELIWMVVNDNAVKTNLAEITTDGRFATVTAKGDGDFRVRCMTKNGTDKVKNISVLEFNASGIGQAYLNPYEFIAGSLYTDSYGAIGNGNEKGVSMSREGDSYVGYENIDFGDFGSDEITIPIFTLSNEEYEIGIWEGRPGEEGSTLLCDGIYSKEMIWNVYQAETYKLSKRLKGITSIYFTAKVKYHIKGFSFTKPEKAFAQIMAGDNSRIYGDTYNVTDSAIEGIGNNVTLEFDDMDFGEKSATKVVICGHSPIENNSIHLRISDESGDRIELLEFAHTEDFEEKEYPIAPVTGNNKISFVFLPGCNFDFRYFRFY